jgi:hypothetical protein
VKVDLKDGVRLHHHKKHTHVQWENEITMILNLLSSTGATLFVRDIVVDE